MPPSVNTKNVRERHEGDAMGKNDGNVVKISLGRDGSVKREGKFQNFTDDHGDIAIISGDPTA